MPDYRAHMDRCANGNSWFSALPRLQVGYSVLQASGGGRVLPGPAITSICLVQIYRSGTESTLGNHLLVIHQTYADAIVPAIQNQSTVLARERSDNDRQGQMISNHLLETGAIFPSIRSVVDFLL